MKYWLIICCVFLLNACVKSDGNPICDNTGENGEISALLVGNSLTRGVQLKLNELLSCGGYIPSIAVSNPSSTYLSEHNQLQETLNKIEIGFDHVVLQEHSSGIHAIHSEPYPIIQSLKEKINAAGSDMMFYQTWGYENQSVDAHIAGYDAVGSYFDSTVIAVGRARQLFEATYGDSRFSLFDDDRHANFHGQVLISYVFYAYLTGQSPVGVSNLDLNASDAEILQTTAWQIYQAYP